MRTLLLNLPWQEGGRLGVRAGSRWPFTSPPAEGRRLLPYLPFPFFLAYATALLKREGMEARLLDAVAEGISEAACVEAAVSYGPGLAVIETSTPSIENDLRIARSIAEALPRCAIAFCGAHASVFARDLLEEYPFIAYVLTGEYEVTVLELARQIAAGEEASRLGGLACRLKGAVRLNRRRPCLRDLDLLPWPEREDVPLYNYNDGFAGLPVPNVQMWSSRGCPFRCTYCLWPQTIYGEHRYRKRDAGEVAKEMSYLVERFGFKAVYFDDDIFNADRRHAEAVCKAIRDKKMGVPWGAMARADLMDEGLLDTLRGAGLYAIKYGVESADPAIQRSCKKRMDLEKTRRVIEYTKRRGIRVHLTFCLGLPGETKETLARTRTFIEETAPDSLQFSFAVPFPGTEYFSFLKQRGWLSSRNWRDYDGNRACVVKTPVLGAEDLEGIRADFSSRFNVQ